MTAFVKRQVSKYTMPQKLKVKTNCRKFNEKHNRKIIILDDETYVITDPSETPRKYVFQATSLDDVEYSMKTQHR